jgi:hypothetical protein
MRHTRILHGATPFILEVAVEPFTPPLLLSHCFFPVDSILPLEPVPRASIYISETKTPTPMHLTKWLLIAYKPKATTRGIQELSKP